MTLLAWWKYHSFLLHFFCSTTSTFHSINVLLSSETTINIILTQFQFLSSPILMCVPESYTVRKVRVRKGIIFSKIIYSKIFIWIVKWKISLATYKNEPIKWYSDSMFGPTNKIFQWNFKGNGPSILTASKTSEIVQRTTPHFLLSSSHIYIR